MQLPRLSETASNFYKEITENIEKLRACQSAHTLMKKRRGQMPDQTFFTWTFQGVLNSVGAISAMLLAWFGLRNTKQIALHQAEASTENSKDVLAAAVLAGLLKRISEVEANQISLSTQLEGERKAHYEERQEWKEREDKLRQEKHDLADEVNNLKLHRELDKVEFEHTKAELEKRIAHLEHEIAVLIGKSDAV